MQELKRDISEIKISRETPLTQLSDPVQTLSNNPIQIMLPFKEQKSADVVCRQLGDLGTKINQLQPVFTSKKIADHLRVTEKKPPLINQQSVVHKFICDLCDTNYIGYTCRNLHQHVEEYKHSDWKTFQGRAWFNT